MEEERKRPSYELRFSDFIPVIGLGSYMERNSDNPVVDEESRRIALLTAYHVILPSVISKLVDSYNKLEKILGY